MQIIIVEAIIVICLGLLPWVEPANAQVEFPLKVSIHKELQRDSRTRLEEGDIKAMLDRASNVLGACKVKLKLEALDTFDFDSAPAIINDVYHLEAVHGVGTPPERTVKVVQQINFCIEGGSFFGCAWRPAGRRPKTVIVTRNGGPSLDATLWAHEFAHTTGLQHRNDPGALMHCRPFPGNILINPDECGCISKGTGGCPTLEPPPAPCPAP
jgi:hypothetical protein